VYGWSLSTSGVGVSGIATAVGGPDDQPIGVYGESAGSHGIGVKGVATADSNESVGVLGLSPFIGVQGSSTGSFGVGVWARASGEGGQAVNAHASAGEAVRASVSGESASAIETDASGSSGTGLEAYASSTSGTTTGIRGKVRSPSGTAVVLLSESTSGTILSGRSGNDPGTEVFRVEGSGQLVVNADGDLTVNAASFFKETTEPNSLAAVEMASGASNGIVLYARKDNAANPNPVVKLVQAFGASGHFLECVRKKVDGTDESVCHIANDGTFVGPSDFAEALPALGDRGRYGPGDILSVAVDGAGVEKASEPYSARVAGIYSTRPGVLGADKGGETRIDESDVPVAIVGIVPTKVRAENGPIAVGDLLVSSSTPGHAMRGTDRSRMQGAVVGKALEPFSGRTGLIRVLVSLL
jgi:hypothetical protein